jgi:putative endonuclease
MYILECSDNTYYTWSTIDLDRRLYEHNSWIWANYTKERLPVKLVYCENHSRIDEAFHREKQIQNWSHIKKRVLIEWDFDKISSKAKKKFL